MAKHSRRSSDAAPGRSRRVPDLGLGGGRVAAVVVLAAAPARSGEVRRLRRDHRHEQEGAEGPGGRHRDVPQDARQRPGAGLGRAATPSLSARHESGRFFVRRGAFKHVSGSAPDGGGPRSVSLGFHLGLLTVDSWYADLAWVWAPSTFPPPSSIASSPSSEPMDFNTKSLAPKASNAGVDSGV